MRSIVRDALVVGVATGAYGVSFGAIASAAGFGVAQACVLSLVMFTGASQFALVAVPDNPGAGAWTALLLGTRNALYGLRIAPLLHARGTTRLAAAHVVIDESTAMAVARDEPADARVAFWATGVSIYVLWNVATFAGALAGDHLSDPEVFGLDAAAPAAFLALLVPRLHGREAWVLAAAAALVALAATPVVPSGVPVLLAAAVAAAAGVRGSR